MTGYQTQVIPSPPSGRCAQCWLHTKQCICTDIPVINLSLKIVVLRHWKESSKVTNTARLAALAIPTLEIHTIGAPNRERISLDDLDDSWLLFPSPTPPPKRPPAQLIILDGTWRQARKMVRRQPGLQPLPRLGLNFPVQRRRLRRPPMETGMSTLEAIGQAIGILEDEAAGMALSDLYEHFSDRVRGARGW